MEEQREKTREDFLFFPKDFGANGDADSDAETRRRAERDAQS